MMESQNIRPDDLVIVIYVPDAVYYDVRIGAVGTVVRVTQETHPLDRAGTYWDVSFSTGLSTCHERILRKIDGEGRKVGRWDFCVFNAPKYVKDQRRELLEQLRAE
jgi:hypothetical protein